MHLFLTGVLPFLAHNHPSAAAFLTCRSKNFHASIIPEFLSDEERVKSFCGARQQNQLKSAVGKQYKHLYDLFVQTPLMQFSPSLVLHDETCFDSILKPLLETKYFTRTLQRCSVGDVVSDVLLTTDLFQSLSKVQSLTKLDLGESGVENKHLEIIINSFPSLETLTIYNAQLTIADPISISSPPPRATKTLRNLAMNSVDALFAAQFIPHFTNLRKLVLSGNDFRSQLLDLCPLSSSLRLLTYLELENSDLKNTDSLTKLVHLSTLRFYRCVLTDLSFLSQENSLPHLTTLCVNSPRRFSSSQFASLSHAPNLHELQLSCADFDNDCLQYLENMVHLRKLNLSESNIVGDSRLLKTLMQNLFQLEELNLRACCGIGKQGAIAQALYNSHSRLRVLNLTYCSVVDDDLNGIGKLKNTLEVLHLSYNRKLTNKAVVHCKDLVKLKVVDLSYNDGINDLSPFEDCLNLEELNVSCCDKLSDDSFKVFSEEPDSFPNLRFFNLSFCQRLTENVLEHLSKNNNLVSRLKELNVEGLYDILSSSPTARNNIGQLKGLN